jgi:hypothetical protein
MICEHIYQSYIIYITAKNIFSVKDLKDFDNLHDRITSRPYDCTTAGLLDLHDLIIPFLMNSFHGSSGGIIYIAE